MKRIINNINFLYCLSESTTKERRSNIIDWALKEHIFTISEIILNLLKGNITIASELQKKLKRHRKTLRKLASKHYSTNKKRTLLKRSAFLIDCLPKILSEIQKTYPDFKYQLAN